MKKKMVIFLLILVLIGSTALLYADESQGKKAGEGVTLKALFMAQASYSEKNVRDMTNEFMAANPGIKVDLEFVPYEELRNKTLMAYGSQSGYDVTLTDDIWFSEFVTKKIIRDISAQVPQNYKDGVLKGAWNVTVKNGKYYGIPWILDTMYLFYNKKMLNEAGFNAPPQSMEELISMAKTIKDKGISDYPVVLSLAQAEALICVYSTVLEAVGGGYQDKNGNYNLDKNGGVEALNYLIQLKNNGLLNPNSLGYLEEDVRRVYSAGDAAFALNWTYMYNLAKDPKESSISADVGITVFPGKQGVKKYGAMSGSMGLSISSKTKNYDAALKYILFLTSRKIQDKYSQLQLPIWKSSYDDPTVQKGQEELVKMAKTALSIMNTRPSDPNYQEISTILQQHIQKALYGEMSAEDALKAAIKQINSINR